MGESGARVKRAARSAGAAARAGKPRAPDVHITCLLRAYVDLTPHRHLRLSRLLEPPVAGHPRCGARGGGDVARNSRRKRACTRTGCGTARCAFAGGNGPLDRFLIAAHSDNGTLPAGGPAGAGGRGGPCPVGLCDDPRAARRGGSPRSRVTEHPCGCRCMEADRKHRHRPVFDHCFS